MKFLKILKYIDNLKTKNSFLEKHINKLQEDINYYMNKDTLKTRELKRLKNEIIEREKHYLFFNNKQYVVKKDNISLITWQTDETKFVINISFYDRNPIYVEFKEKADMMEEYNKLINQL